jgi:hypothetical protein
MLNSEPEKDLQDTDRHREKREEEKRKMELVFTVIIWC